MYAYTSSETNHLIISIDNNPVPPPQYQLPPPQQYQSPPPQQYQSPPPQQYQLPPPQQYQSPPPEQYQFPPVQAPPGYVVQYPVGAEAQARQVNLMITHEVQFLCVLVHSYNLSRFAMVAT